MEGFVDSRARTGKKGLGIGGETQEEYRHEGGLSSNREKKSQ